MEFRPVRLQPGANLRQALESAVAADSALTSFVVTGVGSSVDARLRLAGRIE